MVRLIPRESLKQELFIEELIEEQQWFMDIIKLGEGELKVSNLCPNAFVKV